ncbi:hypothetical protein HF086_007065 [Spodoptera exigua]|uniref:Uncharacterized protein n=1 Tax=Spodoptera exigua TaxID=7107 RepID=A0A922M581_SPOEX|nr:hypothetical protein HF086_007065 [Spodoptera exigua]
MFKDNLLFLLRHISDGQTDRIITLFVTDKCLEIDCVGEGYECIDGICYCAKGYIPNHFQDKCMRCPGLGETCMGPCCNIYGNGTLSCWQGVCQPCYDDFGKWTCRPFGSASNSEGRLSIGSLQLYVDERLRDAPPSYLNRVILTPKGDGIKRKALVFKLNNNYSWPSLSGRDYPAINTRNYSRQQHPASALYARKQNRRQSEYNQSHLNIKSLSIVLNLSLL